MKKEVVGGHEIIHIQLVFRTPATITHAWWPSLVPPQLLPPQNPFDPSTLSNVVYFSVEVENEFVFLMCASRMLVSEAIRAAWELSKLRSELGSLSIVAVSESRDPHELSVRKVWRASSSRTMKQ
jgi:hypothetical protein